jgi:hypothetical protein
MIQWLPVPSGAMALTSGLYSHVQVNQIENIFYSMSTQKLAYNMNLILNMYHINARKRERLVMLVDLSTCIAKSCLLLMFNLLTFDIITHVLDSSQNCRF